MAFVFGDVTQRALIEQLQHLLSIHHLGVLTHIDTSVVPPQRGVNEASRCQVPGLRRPRNRISYIKLGTWGTCNGNTRGPIYDTSNY
jgi:hypothetical protein